MTGIALEMSYLKGAIMRRGPSALLSSSRKSAAVVGFFLLRYASHFRAHLDRLVQLLDSGKLKVAIDPHR